MTTSKTIRYLLFSILILQFPACRQVSEKAGKIPAGQQEMFNLLEVWTNALLYFQVNNSNHGLNGGILCPGCSRIHGRCADAIYPFLYMADKTGQDKYIKAAKDVFSWGENNMRIANGSWISEVNILTWPGITVFGLTALAESLRDFSHLIDDSTRLAWEIRMLEEADFVSSFIKTGVGNVNYSMCACYTLALVGNLTGNAKYSDRAEELYNNVKGFFTENENLLYGEGSYPYVMSKKGTLPIDLGYNVEQTLPYMAAFAQLTGKTDLLEKVKKSMHSHIEFMLGDGAWDNSWGTRNFKWSYWGSRTSDGISPICPVFSSDSLIAEAGYRNFTLLSANTHDGLLFGGPHYKSAGYVACIHHTFSHARALAVALHNGFTKPEKRILLPREIPYGTKFIRDINTWLVSVGDWNATVTDYDSEYHIAGGHVSGGSISLLWNKNTGPLLASAMSVYSMVEPTNMQLHKGKSPSSSAARIELIENGIMYSNIFDKEAIVIQKNTDGAESFSIKAQLLNVNALPPKSGKLEINFSYSFSSEGVKIMVAPIPGKKFETLRLVIPMISEANEKMTKSKEGEYLIKKKSATLKISSNHHLNVLETEANGRIIDMAPGFEAIPFSVDLSEDEEVILEIEVI